MTPDTNFSPETASKDRFGWPGIASVGNRYLMLIIQVAVACSTKPYRLEERTGELPGVNQSVDTPLHSYTHHVPQQEPGVKPDVEMLDRLLKKYPPIDKERADMFGLVKLKIEYEEAVFSKSPKVAGKKSAYQQEIRRFHIKKDKYLAYILAEQEASIYPDSVVLPFRFKHPWTSTIGPCTYLYYQDVLTTIQYNLLHGDPDSLLLCRPEILEKPLHYRNN